jgi:hypothetical protein
MQKGQTIEDRHAESWGQVCWALGWRRTAASWLPSLTFFTLLFSYSLRPYSFAVP